MKKTSQFLKWLLEVVSWMNSKVQSQRQIQNCYITYAGGCDGGGAQIHSIISIIIFAKEFNMEYLHTPISNVEHFEGDRSEWSGMWENYFSLGNGKRKRESFDLTRFAKRKIRYPGLLWKKKNSVYYVSNCHSFNDLFPVFYEKCSDELRQNYKRKIDCSKPISDTYKICIHLRRGDVTRYNKNSFRYTSDEFIINKLFFICRILLEKGLNYQIYVYSQGASEEDFKEFRKLKAIFCLNQNVFETLDALIDADILIMAKSSFSYVAGIFNKGIIFYEPFWHKSLPSWIDISQSIGKMEKDFCNKLSKSKSSLL